MDGKCIIFSAPSGAGKTTIVHKMLELFDTLEFSVSACSRQPRSYEKDGKDYYFLGVEGFKKEIENDAFLEWEEVYEDHFYGTLKSEIQRIWNKGHHVIFDVDVVGGINLKKHFGERALSIFVMPPSVETLEKRLRKRDTENEATLQKRIKKATLEMESAPDFDYVLLNDNLDTAVAHAQSKIEAFLKQ